MDFCYVFKRRLVVLLMVSEICFFVKWLFLRTNNVKKSIFCDTRALAPEILLLRAFSPQKWEEPLTEKLCEPAHKNLLEQV